MTLEEAIKHCEDVADYDCFTDDQRKCSDEHRQLADWLRELKERREKAQLSGEDATFDCISRQDAIDAINAYLGLSAVSRTIQNMTSIQEILENLPSAQPEHLVKESGDLVKDLVNDCISRQNAVKTMYDLCEDIDRESLHIDAIVDALENLQSVEPRKKGKWIYGEKSGQDGWYCSECGGFIPWYYDFYGLDNIDFIEDFKTCPFCDSKMVSYTGADMREGEEE